MCMMTVSLEKDIELIKNGLMYVTDLIRDVIANHTVMSHAVTPEMKVGLT